MSEGGVIVKDGEVGHELGNGDAGPVGQESRQFLHAAVKTATGGVELRAVASREDDDPRHVGAGEEPFSYRGHLGGRNRQAFEEGE
jgi:hypothetical protein